MPSGGGGDESPFASVRELWASEQRLTTTFTNQLSGMESRLTAVVQSSDSRHEETHHQMVANATERHAPIDKFIEAYKHEQEQDAIREAQRTGARRVFTNVWRGITILDDHWRIFAIALAALAVLLREFHISIF